MFLNLYNGLNSEASLKKRGGGGASRPQTAPVPLGYVSTLHIVHISI